MDVGSTSLRIGIVLHASGEFRSPFLSFSGWKDTKMFYKCYAMDITSFCVKKVM